MAFESCPFGGTRSHLGVQLFWVLLLDVGTKGLDPWPVGRSSLPLVTPAPQDPEASSLRSGSQFLGGVGLPNTRLTSQHYYLALSG